MTIGCHRRGKADHFQSVLPNNGSKRKQVNLKGFNIDWCGGGGTLLKRKFQIQSKARVVRTTTQLK